MEINFCRRCGTRLTQKAEGSFVCENGHDIFLNPSPTSSIFFVTEDKQVTLAVRAVDPNKGMLDAPGGFVDVDESFEDALARELIEELGLQKDDYEMPRYLSSIASDYAFAGEKHNVVSVFYWSQLKPGAVPIPQDDVADIQMIPLADIDFDKISGGDTKSALRLLQETLR